MPLPQFEEVHIENTNSCGYRCTMCPRESHTRQIGYMSLDDFSFLLGKLGPLKVGFHLHGFGEPLLDRQLAAKIAVLKKAYPTSPSLIFSTLGVRLKEDSFFQLLEAGLNGMVISLYGFSKDRYQQVHGVDKLDLVKQNLQFLSGAMKKFPNSFNACIKIPSSTLSLTALPMAEVSEKTAFCRWAQSLGFEIGEWTYVHNYGDGRTYNLPDTQTMCPVVSGKRKRILNITWDLNVIPCCYDFNATIKWGNLRTSSLEEIFSSPEYLAFLIAHKTNELSAYPACQNCEKNDYT